MQGSSIPEVEIYIVYYLAEYVWRCNYRHLPLKKQMVAQEEVDQFFNLLKTRKSWEELNPEDPEVKKLAESLESALQERFPKLTTSDALKELEKIALLPL